MTEQGHSTEVFYNLKPGWLMEEHALEVTLSS
jgi:hypothetical protein